MSVRLNSLEVTRSLTHCLSPPPTHQTPIAGTTSGHRRTSSIPGFPLNFIPNYLCIYMLGWLICYFNYLPFFVLPCYSIEFFDLIIKRMNLPRDQNIKQKANLLLNQHNRTGASLSTPIPRTVMASSILFNTTFRSLVSLADCWPISLAPATQSTVYAATSSKQTQVSSSLS